VFVAWGEIVDGGGCFLVERDYSLSEALAGGEAEAGCSVGVGVEAVEVKLADFGAAGAPPAGDEQGAALQSAGQRPDLAHERFELVVRDEAGDLLDAAGHVGVGEQRPGGHVVPLGQRGVPEEHGDDGDDAGLVGGAERFVGVVDFCSRLTDSRNATRSVRWSWSRRSMWGRSVSSQSPKRRKLPRSLLMLSGRRVNARSAT